MLQKLNLLMYVQAVMVIWGALAAVHVFRNITIAIAHRAPCQRLMNKSVVALYLSTSY
jgi:hypothetical protein